MKDTKQNSKELSSRGDCCCHERAVPSNAQKDENLTNADDSGEDRNVHSQLFAICQKANALSHLTSDDGQWNEQKEGIYVDKEHGFHRRRWSLLVFYTGSFEHAL